MDRISYLPQSILHDILSRLHDKDAAVTSVLSKTWYDTWSTFPFLVFYESRFEKTIIPSGLDIQQKEVMSLLDKYNFCFGVFRKLSSFLQKGLAAKTFELIFESFPPPAMFFNDWMKFVCNPGLEELRFDNGLEYPISFDSYDEFDCLPLCVLEVKSLITLQLAWHFRVDQAFLNLPIKFSSLQVLSLKHVYLGDGQVIQNLISSCPLIEKLELAWCYGVKYVSIHDLLKLKVVFIKGIEEIDVDAPSLEDLHFRGLETFISCEIKMHNCRNLRELYLAYVNSIIITDQWLLELFRKCPILEKLVIVGFDMTNLTNISSIQLKVLSLCNCYNFGYLEIDAPNLCKYEYHGDGSIIPLITILNSSSQLVLDVVLCVEDGVLLDLVMLRHFLEDVKRQHLPVYVFLGFDEDSSVDFDIYVFPNNLTVPPSIKHLTLCVISDIEEWCLVLVTNLLWSCRPCFISLSLNSNKTFVKIFCETLIGRKENDCCSISTQICWWHFLKDVKVSHKAEEGDLKNMLEAFPTISSEEEKEINQLMLADVNFMLEWHS